MGNLGFQEMMLLFVLALIFFGPRKLPEIGRTIGKSLAEFRKATEDLRHTWEEEIKKETDGLKEAVPAAELNDIYNSTQYDSYGSVYPNESPYYSEEHPSTASEEATSPTDGTATVSEEHKLETSGRLEPNSTMDGINSGDSATDPAASGSPIEHSETAPFQEHAIGAPSKQ